MAAARLAVFPTRQNLQVMKVKLTGAKKGHSLLKKKADALTMRLRALLKNILQAKEDMGSAFKEGNFALAEVKYAAGDVAVMVKESVGAAQVRGAPTRAASHRAAARPTSPRIPLSAPRERTLAAPRHDDDPPLGSSATARASHLRRDPLANRPHLACASAPSQKRVEIRVDNIAGVKVPVFKAIDTGAKAEDYTGLGRGGQQIIKARQTFSKAVDVLVQLATLQTSFTILDEAIKVTSRRVNALDSVVIPRIANTVEYIKSELDELEREEFFRLKRSQDKKKADIAANEAAKKLQLAEDEAKEAAKDMCAALSQSPFHRVVLPLAGPFPNTAFPRQAHHGRPCSPFGLQACGGQGDRRRRVLDRSEW